MLPTTYLFVPADRPERFAKARSSGSDLIVIDLEDAVAPDAKCLARSHAAEALALPEHRACLRINGAESPWFTEDCELLALPGVAAVMVPKAESADDLCRLAARLGAGVPLIPVVETARGLAAASRLAACARVQRLAFGSVDFQLDLGIEGEDIELLFARSQIVMASRLGGIAPPIDGVTLSARDTAQAGADALRARRLGFGAKLCIHPSHVAPVKEAFMPDAAQLAWARGVLDAVAAQPAGAITYEGKLIDKPVIGRAQAILARTVRF